ncbi:cytochrome c-type biogenesis protein [uncultured Boseongicola sp.]|uniref:cytochrome c-type biogenesis protein n=1 Tax=uncultured Boseongicola sp. TaxID=1648499 RepID=UPI00261B349D|nr:cytochrome c-type biogenesis protein [uncultured Boseongicola sp.]
MRVLMLTIALAIATPALAVQPNEILDDPALEERAREMSKNLRCLVCRNESIDESDAELARDLRLLVRERLVAGDTNDETIDFIVARYGEYVLLTPRATGSTLILWIAGPAMFLAAFGIAAVYIRRRRPEAAPDTLSDAEKSRLSQLMDD